MSYRREVGGVEKHFIAYNDIRPPFVIQMVLEFDAAIEPGVVFDALEVSSKVNPGACLHLEKGDDQDFWVAEAPPTLTVVDAPEYEGYNEVDAPFFTWPMNTSTGPTAEVLLVRAKNKTLLVFRALHAVMDGQGTINWASDVMRCVRGEPPLGHPSDASFDAFMREESTKRKSQIEADALHPYGPARGAGGGHSWRRLEVDRPLDGTVLGRIAVALAAQARASQGDGVVRLNIPTDMRHWRPDMRTTANFFSGLAVDVPPEATADGIGLKVVHQLYKGAAKTTYGDFYDHSSGSLAAHRVSAFFDMAHLHRSGLYGFSATLSHLGSLSAATFATPDMAPASIFFVPLAGDSGCVVSLSGFEDRMVLTCGLSAQFTHDGQLDHLAKLLTDALEAE